MTTNEAIGIIKAIDLLASTLDVPFKRMASNCCLFNDEKFKILKEASDKYQLFLDADIVERGKMLDVEITVTKDGYESETILSED